ncbi:hypothetical protein N9V56_02975 [Alphaproteobacteria bacterium]|nr:hypothetical protein [Alphaproteobacteria bacterium]
MSKFSLKRASNNQYYLFYDEKLFNTSKGNKILIPKIKSQTQFIKQINLEFLKKNSNFMQLLFFSNDIDDNKKKTISEIILNFLDTDTLCFRDKGKPELLVLQKKRWDKYLCFCKKHFYLDFHINYGIFFKKQKIDIHCKIKKILNKMTNYHLTAFYFLVKTTNSIIISLNLLFNETKAYLAWKDSNLEYEYNKSIWGEDSESKKNFLLKKSFFTDIIYFISFFDKE